MNHNVLMHVHNMSRGCSIRLPCRLAFGFSREWRSQRKPPTFECLSHGFRQRIRLKDSTGIIIKIMVGHGTKDSFHVEGAMYKAFSKENRFVSGTL